ncbi:hypothetical protein V6U90_27355 [Micromonospora sp. CPCC 206060]|uniref:hypothetical protein n=1 Tax=Micromonospora sp. CPCC 206060 TaxID=3122406 RepID=UPI002FF31D5A
MIRTSRAVCAVPRFTVTLSAVLPRTWPPAGGTQPAAFAQLHAPPRLVSREPSFTPAAE